MDMDGRELQRRRKALGLSVAALAKALGVTRVSLYRWEREGVWERVEMVDLALRYLEDQAARDSLSDGRDDDG